MWKKLLVVATMAVSAQAFAGEGSVKYSGSGDWKSPDGKAGNWSETAEVTKGSDGVLVHEVVTVNDSGQSKTMDFQYKAANDQNGFFDVLDQNGNKIGNGYCFELKSGVECHSQVVVQGFTCESTMAAMEGRAYVLGSGTGSEGGKTMTWAYTGKLVRAL